MLDAISPAETAQYANIFAMCDKNGCVDVCIGRCCLSLCSSTSDGFVSREDTAAAFAQTGVAKATIERIWYGLQGTLVEVC